jgi:hypothetical protein
LALLLFALLGFMGWRLSIPIREWLSTSSWTHDFFREKVQPKTDVAPVAVEEAGAKPPGGTSGQGAWGELKSFLKADPGKMAEFTLEGAEELAVSFERLFGPSGRFPDGLPPPESFQVSGDRDLMDVLGPGWVVYEADRTANPGQPVILLAWRETGTGEFRLAGRFFLETVEEKLRGFASRTRDPDAKWEFLARIRPRLTAEQAMLPDPAAPYVEVLPPIGEDPVGVVLLADGDPIRPSLSPDSPSAVTILLGRSREPGGELNLLAPPLRGWPGGLTDGRLLPGQDEASRLPEFPALSVARAFLAAKPSGRLDYVNSRDNAMLLNELEQVYGPSLAGEVAVEPILVQPRTTSRAGAVAVRVRAPTLDGDGACILWLVPFAGSYKIEGQLWAQSYYGWFRSYLKTPLSTPRELRGIVFSAGDEATPGKFRFRDVHSAASVELALPEGSAQTASLAKLSSGEGRSATLRLRWEDGEVPRIVLDEWICWGYRGIDEQAY